MELISADGVPTSYARVEAPTNPPIRVGLVQHAWREDPDELAQALREGIDQAAGAGAQVVFLPEIAMLRYPADKLPTSTPSDIAEELADGPSFRLAKDAATANGIYVHVSLYERADAEDGLGFNTSILVAPNGELVGRTRKTHIPVTAGYYEDKYFRAGPPEDAYPVVTIDNPDLKLTLGMPTCWDEWFPEVARAYGLAGAQVLTYPTAIGSEPDHPEFDTMPLWRQVISAHAIENGLFIVVPNRTGNEGDITFYGSSFIVDPYGRILVEAPRDREAVLVADLDLAQGKDWLDLFPFLATRRPDTYATLAAPIKPEHVRADPNA